MKTLWSLIPAVALVGCAPTFDDLDEIDVERMEPILALDTQGSRDEEAIPVPDLTFCAPQADGRLWNDGIYREADGSSCSRGLECDNVEYSCIEPMAEAVEYTVEDEVDSDVDCAGQSLRRIAFVVDGSAGELRYNANTCSGTDSPAATLLVFSGGGGTVWRDTFGSASEPVLYRDPDGDGDPLDNDYRALELAGIRVVGVRWATGVKRSIWDLGWITRSHPGPVSFKEKLRKPAAVMKFVGSPTGLRAPGTTFGIAGTSAGGLQSSAALLLDIESEVDYLGLHAGGGLGVALPFSCGQTSSDIRVDPETGGICFEGDRCWLHGAAEQPAGVKEVWDYALAPVSCSTGSAADLGRVSFVSMDWAGVVPTHMGFLVNNDWASDNGLGATWSAGIMRWLVYFRLGVLGEWANGSGFHGEVMASGHPSFGLFKEQALAALLNR